MDKLKPFGRVLGSQTDTSMSPTPSSRFISAAGRFLRQRVAERHAQIHLQAQHPFVPGQRRLKASLPIETKQIGGVDCEGRDVFSACRLQRFLIFFGGIEGIVGSCCTFGMLQPRTRSCNRTSRRGYQERAQAIQRQSVPFICAGAAALLRHLKGLCDGSDQLDIAPKPRRAEVGASPL